MPSRLLNDLHPDMKPLMRWFLDECQKQGIDVLVTCTWRSNDEQGKLYAQGRSTPGRIVTNAKPGQSMHNFMLNGVPASKAFDVVPLIHGKPEWDASNPVWEKMGEIGESVGLEWAGHWIKWREFPHFQLRNDTP